MQKYGRGKVVQRHSRIAQTPDNPQTAPPSSLQQQASSHAVSHVVEPAAHYRLGPWRCAARLESGQVPEVQCMTRATTWSETRALRERQPLCLRGLDLLPCGIQAAADVLMPPSIEMRHPHIQARTAVSYSSSPQPLLSVLCSTESTNRFIEPDTSKNLQGSYYHIRKPETSILHMSFPEYVQRSAVEQQHRLLLRADVCSWQIVHDGTKEQAMIQPNEAVYPHLGHLLRPANAANDKQQQDQQKDQQQQALGAVNLEWQTLSQLLEQGCWKQCGAMSIESGGEHALLPAQYHTQDRLLCQVSGRRRMLLVPPEQAFAGCYPYPVAHAYDTYSAVDFEEPEEQWLLATQVQGLVCELAPGDALVMPAFWFLHSELLQPRTVTLVLSLVPGPERCLTQGALELQLARMVELWAAAEVGPANVRAWLQAMGKGHELHELQLDTTEGYRRLRMCERIKDAAELVMGARGILNSSDGSTSSGDASSRRTCSQSQAHSSAQHMARQFLLSMCQGRLMPTDWLNANVSDPLYLRHPPEHYEVVEEDAEAARYPQLFRHKLTAARPDWKVHAKRITLGSAAEVPRLVT